MLSIVIPVYNEEEVLETLYNRLIENSVHWGQDFEVILVDDGSRDRSFEIAKELNAKDKRFKTVSFSRNFGHQIAVSAGLQYASGDVVAVMDADLQDPPEFMVELLKKWKEGYEVVFAVRQGRKENIFKKLAYWLFYRILYWAAEIQIPLDTGDFCVMDKKVVKLLNSLPEKNRFVRGLRSWLGFRQIGIPFERGSRLAGEVKYTFGKLFKLAFDGVVGFSYKPLQLFGYFGFFVSFSSILLLILLGLDKVFGWHLTPYDLDKTGYFPLLFAVLFLGGVQLIGLGLLGEYLGRVFDEVKNRPLFLVKELVGITEKNESEVL
ncbi:MAG: glycosyltransferase family 2 protein [Leptospiraceae bacterium]|nr:glycosyltransferase family 2 protein [Leptospiraceae bacterium]